MVHIQSLKAKFKFKFIQTLQKFGSEVWKERSSMATTGLKG